MYTHHSSVTTTPLKPRAKILEKEASLYFHWNCELDFRDKINQVNRQRDENPIRRREHKRRRPTLLPSSQPYPSTDPAEAEHIRHDKNKSRKRTRNSHNNKKIDTCN